MIVFNSIAMRSRRLRVKDADSSLRVENGVGKKGVGGA
jgi:hypothetical protein